MYPVLCCFIVILWFAISQASTLNWLPHTKRNMYTPQMHTQMQKQMQMSFNLPCSMVSFSINPRRLQLKVRFAPKTVFWTTWINYWIFSSTKSLIVNMLIDCGLLQIRHVYDLYIPDNYLVKLKLTCVSPYSVKHNILQFCQFFTSMKNPISWLPWIYFDTKDMTKVTTVSPN